MTDETEIPLSEAQPGDMVWLKPGPYEIKKVDTDDPVQPIDLVMEAELRSSMWPSTSMIHRITRPISEVDALRARVAELEADT